MRDKRPLPRGHFLGVAEGCRYVGAELWSAVACWCVGCWRIEGQLKVTLVLRIATSQRLVFLRQAAKVDMAFEHLRPDQKLWIRHYAIGLSPFAGA